MTAGFIRIVNAGISVFRDEQRVNLRRDRARERGE